MDRYTDGSKNNVAHTLLLHREVMLLVWLKSTHGLGGDSMRDKLSNRHRQTDRKIMLLSHTLTMWGSNVACLIEFRPVV